MRLENRYYSIIGIDRQNVTSAVCHVELLPDCEVYRGHFPGEPVCPGVCNMQMIKECAEVVVGKPLHQSSVSQCRLTSLMTPVQCSALDVRVDILSASDTSCTIKATISDCHDTYMEYKGEMTV